MKKSIPGFGVRSSEFRAQSEISNLKPQISNLRGRHTQRGSVYVIALLTLAVLGMLAGVLGWSALVRAQQSFKRENSRHLESLVQSGVTYASWQRRYKGKALPFNFSVNLSSGSITGRAEEAPTYGSDAMKITVNATYKDAQLTRGRIISGAKRARQSTEFALFINSSFFVKNGSLKIEGDLHVNGHLITQNGWGMYATGSITSAGNQNGNILTDTYSETNTPDLSEDLPTMLELRMRATQLLIGSLNLPFGITLGTSEIQYVQGDLDLRGNLRGTGIVVVEGNLIFTGNTQYVDSRSLFVFVVKDDIVIPANTHVVGYLITKNGNVHIGANSSIEQGGVLVADGMLDAQGDLAIVHDPRVNTDFFRKLSRVLEIDVIPAGP